MIVVCRSSAHKVMVVLTLSYQYYLPAHNAPSWSDIRGETAIMVLRPLYFVSLLPASLLGHIAGLSKSIINVLFGIGAAYCRPVAWRRKNETLSP